jgi:class 3 adenylate cyclase
MSGEPAPPTSGADIRTFLFADMRGYTRFTQEHGDEAASALAGRFADLVKETVPAFEGELLELRGDEALCVFRSARQALRASVELQRRRRIGSDEQPAFPIGVGMGLDAGEAVPTHGGYRGASLNLAARLCALAKPGEILASETVIGLASRVEGMRFLEGRSATLKGMARPVRYVVVEPQEPLPPPPKRLPIADSKPSWRQPWMIGTAGVILIAGVVALLLVRGSSSGGGGQPSVAVHANTVAEINPATGLVVRDVPVDRGPVAITIGFGDAWVANSIAHTVSKIDLRSGQLIDTVPLTASPDAITTGDRYVWAFDQTHGYVFQIDPRQDTVVSRYQLKTCVAESSRGCLTGGIAVGFGRVWLGDGLTEVYTLNPATNRIKQWPGTLPAAEITIANNHVYTANDSTVALLYPYCPTCPYRSATPYTETVPVGVYMFLGIAADTTRVWAVSPHGYIYQFDPTIQTPTSARLPSGVNSIALTGTTAWVTNIETSTLLHVSPSLRVTQRIPLNSLAPTDIAATKNRIWVTIENPKDEPVLI